jgi:hypothetical protein
VIAFPVAGKVQLATEFFGNEVNSLSRFLYAEIVFAPDSHRMPFG